MPPGLEPWIMPATVIAAFAFLYRKIDRVETQLGDLRERMAHLGGLLEGLQSTIMHRDAA